MIVLLEGPDGVGKTTLADALEAAWTGPVHRMRAGPPGDLSPYDQYMDMINEAMRFSKETLVVIDRMHVGEMVYGPILRGRALMSFDEVRAIDTMMDSFLDTKLIHCFLPYEEMVRRQIERDGGKPDEKSGASLKHAGAIRAGFAWMLGRKTGGDRFLPGSWIVLDMRGYPDQLAEAVLSDGIEEHPLVL